MRVNRDKVLAYVLCGLCCGVAALFLSARFGGASYTLGSGRDVFAISACVIGGVSMSGGRGTVIGVLLGSFIMAMIPKALPLLHIDALWQNTIKGVLILVVVVVNAVLQRVADRNALSRREM